MIGIIPHRLIAQPASLTLPAACRADRDLQTGQLAADIYFTFAISNNTVLFDRDKFRNNGNDL